ncbi:MAG: penicillin-binding protein 2 [Alphaproteobacteria bacterium]|nr:penicillin-binding protein 2 [Alphaproteobacteria bacterium]
MKQNADTVKVFSRRAFVIGGLQASLLAVLGGRLAYLQVSQGQRYKMMADKNRISIKMIAPSRGEIVDRFGVPLAVNNQNFRALIVTEQAKDVEKSLRELQKIIDLSDKQIEKTIKESKKRPKFTPIEVKDDLSWEDVARIEVNLPDLPGISTDVGERRTYPFGESTAHIVGYVGAVNEKEIDKDPVLSLPGFKIGKTGIEKSFDKELRGTAGASEAEVNVIGREVRELNRIESGQGKRITLTIDGELQRFAQDRLAEQRSVSAVVMDAHTGAVYALASYPAFNPNEFTSGLSVETWQELLADAAHPLTNKAISGQYPPASTFKMIVLMAGLKSGHINANTTVYCPGHYTFGTDRFHCWKKSGHGWVNYITALAYSCDTFFYELSTEIGIENIAAMAREMGLGERLGFDLPNESAGLVADPAWKFANRGQKWQPGETIVSSIGQGSMQATPLQLAVMTARLVNGGYAVKPWVSGYVGDVPHQKEDWPKLDLNASHLAMVKKGMDTVVNSNKGTAYGSRIQEPGMEMGGKTGTAQVKRITKADRVAGIKNEDLVWQHRHHALFVGYAPVDNPRYVVSVVVEHGGGGSAAAAPIARDLMLEVQKRDPANTSIFAGQTKGKPA